MGSLLLATQAQETRSFEDDDPSNDPNVCYDSPDPNCDWDKGWFQAALNVGHITIQAAQDAYEDMHVNEWLPEKEKRKREEERKLFEDDDPANDPNVCYDSPDPNCDWDKGWARKFAQVADWVTENYGPDTKIARIRVEKGVTQIIVGDAPEEWLKQLEKEKLEQPPTGTVRTTIRGLCPPGTVPVFVRGQPTTCQ